MMHAMRTAAVVLLIAVMTATAGGQEIDLKLFDKAVVDLKNTCSVTLWQANRDRDNDRFAYVFLEKMDKKHTRQPARIQIGADVVALRRVSTGGRKSGYDLYEYQLYRMPAEHSYVVLQLKLGDIEGEAVDIESGFMTVIQPGKLPARVSVKGGAGCWF